MENKWVELDGLDLSGYKCYMKNGSMYFFSKQNPITKMWIEVKVRFKEFQNLEFMLKHDLSN